MKNSKFLRSKNLLKSLEAEELKSLNDERQKRENNSNIDSVSERYRSHGMTGGTERCPTKSARNDGRAAFTLVELVITIAIVIILSVISVPIYRGYVDKAKLAEGYALLGTILSAQKTYYSEYGSFVQDSSVSSWRSIDDIFGIDIRGNKYFTVFRLGEGGSGTTKMGALTYFSAGIRKPEDLISGTLDTFVMRYNITKGATILERSWQ